MVFFVFLVFLPFLLLFLLGVAEIVVLTAYIAVIAITATLVWGIALFALDIALKAVGGKGLFDYRYTRTVSTDGSVTTTRKWRWPPKR